MPPSLLMHRPARLLASFALTLVLLSQLAGTVSAANPNAQFVKDWHAAEKHCTEFSGISIVDVVFEADGSIASVDVTCEGGENHGWSCFLIPNGINTCFRQQPENPPDHIPQI